MKKIDNLIRAAFHYCKISPPDLAIVLSSVNHYHLCPVSTDEGNGPSNENAIGAFHHRILCKA